MGKVLLCIGRYADKPYFMERAYIHLYSVEELCYCMIQNAYLIGEEVMDGRLTDWLEQECGLEELAARLRKLEREGKALGAYAAAVLEYVGYGSREEVGRTRDILEEELDLNIYEKRKNRADYLMGHMKYLPALRGYDSLLQELPRGERELRAKVFHNRGVAYARLFRFESAARSFEQALDWGGGEASYIGFLAAKRLALEETEYIDFLAGHMQPGGLSLKVEGLMENASREFEGTQESRMLFTLRVCREEGQPVSYYDEIEKLMVTLKKRYREITAEQ